MLDCRAYNGAQKGSEHGQDDAVVCAGLCLRMKTIGLSNRSAKLGTVKLKAAALANLCLMLRFEGLENDSSSEDHWRELKDAVAEAPQTRYGKRAVAAGAGLLVKR